MQTNRRGFLRCSLGATALSWLDPTPSLSVAQGDADLGDTVLVVVELSGGNDGLNSVVPYADDEYYRKRPSIGLPASRLHRINDHVGFHPNLKEFQRLLDAGQLSVLQGVGYPEPSGDHEISLRYWQTACPHDAHCQTGWLGRWVDSIKPTEPPAVPAVFVGESRKPFTLNAAQSVIPTLRSAAQWQLESVAGGQAADAAAEWAELATLPRPAAEQVLLRHLQQSTSSAARASERIRQIIERHSRETNSSYPPHSFAKSLDAVAQLIRADVGIRVFCAEFGGDGFGGFDNHANQLGNHCALLRQLAESIGAFVADLQRDGELDRVLLMTFSEFGRTIAENGRRGTDHGSAAPVFLAGGKLRPGLIGDHPQLTEPENGGLPFHTDFRRLYATVLEQWLGFDSRACLGEAFPTLEILQT